MSTSDFGLRPGKPPSLDTSSDGHAASVSGRITKHHSFSDVVVMP